MENEALACFPGGIRALLVDDDPRFLKMARILLSLCNYKVTTCSSPHSAMKVLRGREFDVLLSDAHKVASCGFDFRSIVEVDLRIPVVYCVSFDTGEADNTVINTLQAGSYMIRKPFDGEDIKNLWRVVAWRKFCLETKASAQVVARENGNGKAPVIESSVVFTDQVRGRHSLRLTGTSSRNAGAHVYYKELKMGKSKSKKDETSSESKKHRILWTPTLTAKFEGAVQRLGIDAVPSQILKDMNVEGLRRGHVASHLQKYRVRMLKNNGYVRPAKGSGTKRPSFTGAAGSRHNYFVDHAFPLRPSEHQTAQASNSISLGATGDKVSGRAISPPPELMPSADYGALGDGSSLATLGFSGEAAIPAESDEFPLEALLGLDFWADGEPPVSLSGADGAYWSSWSSEE